MNTDALPPAVKQRIEDYFYQNYSHVMNGHAWLQEHLQVKLKYGAPAPPLNIVEGIPIEYEYEEAFVGSALSLMSGGSFKRYLTLSNLSHSFYTRWNPNEYNETLLQFMNSPAMAEPVALEGGTTTEDVPPRTCLHEFIRGGISTGTTRTGGGSGTLGGIAFRATDGIPVLVSNYHVWCISYFQLGDRVSQPSRSDASFNCSNRESVHIGKLAKYVPVKIRTKDVSPQPIDNYVDCAYCSFLDLATQKRDVRVIDLGLNTGHGIAAKGQRCAKSGRTTQTTFGTVTSTNVKIKVNNYQMPDGGRGFAYFGGLIQMSEMVHGGDSGSLLYNRDNNTIIGLCMGGLPGKPSYACDIQRVSTSLGIKGKKPPATYPSLDLPIGAGIEINPIVAGLGIGALAGMML